MTALLIIFLIFFVVLPVLGRWKLWRMQRRMQDYFDQMSGRARQEEAPRKAGWSKPRSRNRKKIDSSIGEYVKFEEMHADETASNPSTSNNVVAETESQITDVEWEDIK